MKKTKTIFILLITLILAACSGSETYRGYWKATDEKENQLDIIFGENDFSIVEQGDTTNFKYSQNSITIKNSAETYGISLDDGRSFQIHFPIGNDESKGAILDADGRLIYIISRTEYIGYKDVYGF